MSNECKFCGRQCEDEYCCNEHREYQAIYEVSDVVPCPKCGTLCQKIDVHKRYKHPDDNFKLEYPKLKYTSKKYSAKMSRASVIQMSKLTSKERGLRGSSGGQSLAKKLASMSEEERQVYLESKGKV